MAEDFDLIHTLRKVKSVTFCVICELECKTACVRCHSCKKFVHAACTLLPPYMLIMYKHSNSRYQCQNCLKDESGEEKYFDEIDQMTKLISISDHIDDDQISLPYSTPKPNQKPANHSISTHLGHNNDPSTKMQKSGQTAVNHQCYANLEHSYDSSIKIKNTFDALGNANDPYELPSSLPALPLDQQLIAELMPSQTASSLLTSGQRTQNTRKSYSSTLLSDSSVITSGQRSRQNITIAKSISQISSKNRITCRYFLKNKCRYGELGEKCRYNHPSNYQRNSTLKTQAETNKKTICKYFANNACKFGKVGYECRFYHPPTCPNFVHCKSNECTMYHPRICKSSQEKLECSTLKCRLIHLKGTKRSKSFEKHKENGENFPERLRTGQDFLETQIHGIQTQLNAILRQLPFPWWQKIPPPPNYQNSTIEVPRLNQMNQYN